MKESIGAVQAASRLLGIALLAAAFGPGRAMACTPDSLGNTGAGAYAIQSSGVLEAVQAQSAYSFSMSSISINIYQISGTAQLNVAFYSDSGGAPGALLAQSSSGPQTAAVGWNSFAMPALTYSAGTYWLAFQASSGGVWFRSDFSVSPTVNTTQNNTFGAFPASWSGSGFNDYLWSDYAQICSDIPTPTPTGTATGTETLSAAPTPSGTGTSAPSGTPSPTLAPSLTSTPSPSATPSAPPSFTQSPTATYSRSATGTCTATASPTLSLSPSPIATWTPSPLPSPSATWTQSPLSSPTDTGTPPAAATSTPSPRPSRSPTATPSPQPSMTPACASGPVWPNPFTPSLATNQAVQFCVAPGHPAGTLRVYNLKRRLIRSIAFGAGQPVAWDGRDSQGSVVLFGVYPYLLQSGGRAERGAVTVLR